VVSQQNADIADTLQLRDVTMANIFWLSIHAVQIGTTRQIRLNHPCAAAMRPYVNFTFGVTRVSFSTWTWLGDKKDIWPVRNPVRLIPSDPVPEQVEVDLRVATVKLT